MSLSTYNEQLLGAHAFVLRSFSSSIMATVMDPGRLSGLKQAAFVMKCITTGQRMDEITMSLGGDEQLVNMWLSFLKHNHWMIHDGERWVLTPKGAMWSKNVADPMKVTP